MVRKYRNLLVFSRSVNMRSLRVFYYSAKTRVEKPQLSTFSVHNQFLLSLLFHMTCEHPCFVVVFFFISSSFNLKNHFPLTGIPVIFALQLLHSASKTSEQCFRSSSVSDVFGGYCQRTVHFCDIKNKTDVIHCLLLQFHEFICF